MVFTKNLKIKKVVFFILHYKKKIFFILHLIFCCDYCSTDLKKQSEHSGLRSLVCIFIRKLDSTTEQKTKKTVVFVSAIITINHTVNRSENNRVKLNLR